MAVHIDVDAFRDSIPEAVLTAATRLRGDGSVGECEAIGGGAQAVVRDQHATLQPWVGVVARAFTGDCDCSPDGYDLCAHAVAVALTAFEAGVVFAASGTPPRLFDVDPRYAEFLHAAQRLAPRQLKDLVARHATRDRLFATVLLGEAGLLDPADQSGLDDFRAVLQDVSTVTTGSRWGISDVEKAGQRLAAEAEILCARPAKVAALDLVEDAIAVWDELAGHLIDAHYHRSIEPEEIGDPLVDAHHDLCERLDLSPDDIAGRLTRLVEGCQYDTVDVEVYADLLGDHVGRIGRSARW